MQLVMRRYRLRFRPWARFRILAQMVIDKEEWSLIEKYKLRRVLITEGRKWRDRGKALLIAIPIALFIDHVILLLGTALGLWRPPAFDFSLGSVEIVMIVVFWVALALCLLLINPLIRKTIRVKDLLRGRNFKARSFIGLLEKEQSIRKMSAAFALVVEQARTWEEPEVVDLEPQPLLTVLEDFDRVAA